MESNSVTSLNIEHVDIFLRVGYHQVNVNWQVCYSLDITVLLSAQGTVRYVMSVHDVKVDERAADLFSQLAVIIEFLNLSAHDGW